MRKKIRLLGILSGVALAVCVSSNANASIHSAPFTRARSQVQTQTQTKQPVQEFQGTIEKSGAKYILEDKASGAKYQIDKQDKARQFVGKDVKITGTLDPSTNTIEVSEIKAEGGD